MAKQQNAVILNPVQRKQISLLAMVDDRTLRKALAGEPVKPLCRERIRRALIDRGLDNLLPPEPK